MELSAKEPIQRIIRSVRSTVQTEGLKTGHIPLGSNKQNLQRTLQQKGFLFD